MYNAWGPAREHLARLSSAVRFGKTVTIEGGDVESEKND